MSESNICTNCGTIGGAVSENKGSFAGEIGVLLVGLVLCSISVIFILIPICYSLWRHMSAKDVCSACKSENMIPIDTPAGKQLREKYHSGNKS